jgi:hypothetical protein
MKFSCLLSSWGLFHQTFFFAKQKDVFGKNLPFNFTKKNLGLKLGQNLPKLFGVRLTPFTKKKAFYSVCAKNSCKNIDEIDQSLRKIQ